MAKRTRNSTPRNSPPQPLSEGDLKKVEGGHGALSASAEELAKRRRTAAAQFAPKPGIEGSDIGSGAAD